MSGIPGWVVMHVPHDSRVIPHDVRGQYCLSGTDLDTEILKMTDHHTRELFTSELPPSQVVCLEVSRLVVDVERFEDDRLESMASRGMGVIYTSTQDGRSLRNNLSIGERSALIEKWYRPHHAELTKACERNLQEYGRSLVVDCHSFPSSPLPYEVDQDPNRPEICIGSDDFHSPAAVVDALAHQFSTAGFTVAVNAPFAGALVPMLFYGKNARVSAVMVEVRRDIYMDEKTGQKRVDFYKFSKFLNEAICNSIQN